MASLALSLPAAEGFTAPPRKPERPALRYHGGKFMLAPWILEHMPPHRAYVEPFGGAMSVLLLKEPAFAEYYNDLDDRVVEYFGILRDPVSSARLRQLLTLTPFHRCELELAGEWHDDPIERARRLVVRSFMSHGSDGVTSNGVPGFHSSLPRSGSAPARDWANLPAHLEVITARLREVHFENRPALDVLKRYDTPDTLVYVDPPYFPDTRSEKRRSAKRVSAYRHELTAADHRALLKQLREMKSMVMLSGYNCELYERMLKGWTRYDKRAAQSDGQINKVESLWLNPLAEARRPSPSLFGVLA